MSYNENNDQDYMYDFASMYKNTKNSDSNVEVITEFEQKETLISGAGIVGDEEESSTSLSDMLKSLNESNASAVELEKEQLRKEMEKKEAADRQLRKEAQEKLYKERYEEEQQVLEKMRIEEEEEERRAAEEAEAKRKANPLYKLKEAAANTKAKSIKKDESTPSNVEEEHADIFKSADAESTQSEDVPAPGETENPSNETAEKKNKKGIFTKKEKEPKLPKEKKQKSALEKEPDFEYLATHDQLTGVKNLTAYEMDVKRFSTTKNLVILFFDVNDLKYTNDTLGHAIGNKLITTASSTLAELFGDSVYRIGGDEFVVIYQGKKAEDLQKTVDSKIAKFQSAMTKATKEDEDGLTYSVSVGYAIGDGKKTVSEIQEEADKSMYAHKQAYKSSRKKPTPKKQVDEEKPRPDHDELLSDEQRMLKGVIRDNHFKASEESTEKILREIQTRSDDVIAILVADPNFDYLFIIQDVDNFIQLVLEMDNLIDYSYLYAVYENGTQFYGVDEYFDEVTDLFKEIGNAIKSSRFLSDKELLKIPGINIFRNISMD